MAREELISSAVTFLQDPSVSSAPLEKKISFLQSKNLTKEEIDLAFARVGDSPPSAAPASSQTTGYVAQQQPASYRQAPVAVNHGYGYGPGPWQAGPPPELPRRDWRDWFIMATVVGGVSYGLYAVAKRYISPLIAPPTPPQLEQDKEKIDEQFSRAFALLDQLSSDTATLKSAEEARTERLDTALREVEDVVSELKNSSRRRDDETRRISEEVRSLKDGIPRAIEGAREGNEKRLRELGSEVKSLKILLGNRMGPSSSPAAPATQTAPAGASTNTAEASGASSGSQPPATSPGPTPAASQPTPTPASRETSRSPFSQLGKPASIPAWQMAAANKSKSPGPSSADDNSGSGSTVGADNQQSSAPPS